MLTKACISVLTLRRGHVTFCVRVRYMQVEISENHISNFLLTNLARFSLDVSLDVTGPCELLQYLEATPKKATTEIGKQLQLSLSFCPRNVCNLQNVVLSIKVRYQTPLLCVLIDAKALHMV